MLESDKSAAGAPDVREPQFEADILESVRSDGFFRTYANSAQIETSVWDLKFVFGELLRTGNKIVVEQTVAISMSPQHAKALLGVLETNIREYEKKFGKINLPASGSSAQAEPSKDA